MSWKHLDTGKRSAQANMELDAALLEDLEHESDPILHLYDWEGDAATYGHFIAPEKFLNLEGVKKRGLGLGKRPTGGGIIFHTSDLAFSVLVPASHPVFSSNPLENYAFVNRLVITALRQMVDVAAELLPDEPEPLDAHCKSFCMAKPTKYDVMIEGKKVGGAAQRKTKHGYLHQGSIALGWPSEQYLLDVLAPETDGLEGMRRNSFSLLGENWSEKELQEARLELRNHIQQIFKDAS